MAFCNQVTLCLSNCKYKDISVYNRILMASNKVVLYNRIYSMI
jgi:hypothetical protein